MDKRPNLTIIARDDVDAQRFLDIGQTVKHFDLGCPMASSADNEASPPSLAVHGLTGADL
jgi:hypothetical protein